MSKYSEQQIAEHISNLGVNKGDTVLARARLRKLNAQAKDTFLNGLLLAVGEEGTVLTLAFNDHFYYPFFNKKFVFTKKGYTNSGSFPKQVIQHSKGYRSTHPTCSYAAIGKNAELLTVNHDHTSTSYDPIRMLIELDGKMLTSGCLEESPGFTTVHYAQETLGLSKKTLLKNIAGIYFEHEGKVKKFFRRDNGGCSLGFGKLYEHYINKGKLKHGMIGDAHSLLISAKEAYEIDYKILKDNPRVALCNNSGCTMCRATWTYNKKEMIFFIIFELPKKVFKRVLSII